MSHGCCIHSSHYGRVCPSFLSSHVYDRANKRVLSPRSTHELPSRCPSVHPFFLPSFLPSFAGIWQAALMSPGAFHRPSTKYSFSGPIHDTFILSWHHEARTHSFLVRS
jgi:hypothetical protein